MPCLFYIMTSKLKVAAQIEFVDGCLISSQTVDIFGSDHYRSPSFTISGDLSGQYQSLWKFSVNFKRVSLHFAQNLLFGETFAHVVSSLVDRTIFAQKAIQIPKCVPVFKSTPRGFCFCSPAIYTLETAYKIAVGVFLFCKG